MQIIIKSSSIGQRANNRAAKPEGSSEEKEINEILTEQIEV